MRKLKYNTLAFIRYYFHIPESCRLSWALIEETVDGETEIRLGVVFLNRPNFYIDVAMRRFFTETALFGGGLVRKVHAARRKATRDGFVYTAGDGLTPADFQAIISGMSTAVRCILRTCAAAVLKHALRLAGHHSPSSASTLMVLWQVLSGSQTNAGLPGVTDTGKSGLCAS